MARQPEFTIKILRNHFNYESLWSFLVTLYVLYNNVYIRLFLSYFNGPLCSAHAPPVVCGYHSLGNPARDHRLRCLWRTVMSNFVDYVGQLLAQCIQQWNRTFIFLFRHEWNDYVKSLSNFPTFNIAGNLELFLLKLSWFIQRFWPLLAIFEAKLQKQLDPACCHRLALSAPQFLKLRRLQRHCSCTAIATGCSIDHPVDINLKIR